MLNDWRSPALITASYSVSCARHSNFSFFKQYLDAKLSIGQIFGRQSCSISLNCSKRPISCRSAMKRASCVSSWLIFSFSPHVLAPSSSRQTCEPFSGGSYRPQDHKALKYSSNFRLAYAKSIICSASQCNQGGSSQGAAPQAL